MDDWTSVIERIVTDNAQWLDLTQRRPLLFSTFLIQNRLFGLNITAYYFSLWFLYLIMAALLYAIISNIPLAYTNLFGLITALIFLIYPTNYTHLWLIMFGVYLSAVFTMLYGYLLLKFAQGGNWLLFALALISLLFPLGIYEGQMGLASAWAIILFMMYRKNSIVRRFSLLVPIFLMGIYAVWRTVGYQAAGVTDQYLAQVTTSPSVLFSRLVLGYKVSLVWGWTTAVLETIPWVSSAKIAILLLGAMIILLWSLSWTASIKLGKNVRNGNDRWIFQQRWSHIYHYMIAAIAGLILVGAGYVPIMTVFLPNLSGIGSRFNIFATIGGSVFIAAVLIIASLIFTSNAKQTKTLFLASSVPFIVLGILTQASVQYHNRVAWREQQTIWKELFNIAPDFKDDTMVLFILPGFENRTGFSNWRRTPLSASWESSSGVRLLYNNATLLADVYFPDIEEPIEPSITIEGVYSKDTAVQTPFSRVVVFMYDNRSGTLKQLKQLPSEFVEDTEEPIELCSNCILDNRVSNSRFRELVLD